MSDTPRVGTVYLIHFETKLHHAQHYLGFTTNLEERLKRHASGNGSKLMHAVSQAGITWKVTRLWENVPQSWERELKQSKNTPCLCPECAGKRAMNRKVNPKELL